MPRRERTGRSSIRQFQIADLFPGRPEQNNRVWTWVVLLAHSSRPNMFKRGPKNLSECIAEFSIVSGMLHGCSNLFFVLPPLLMMFEACSVAVFGWQRVSTALYGAITRRRLSVRHGWNVSGVNTGCPGSNVSMYRVTPPSLTVLPQTAASPNSDGRCHGTVTELSSAPSVGSVISEPCTG